MINIDTLDTLAHLQREMATAHRKVEEEALRDAMACLTATLEKAEDGVYTTGEAAQRLGVSIPTVKRWINRGMLRGLTVGARWLVGKESVERIVRVRQTLTEMNQEEGEPTADEFIEFRRMERRAGKHRVA